MQTITRRNVLKQITLSFFGIFAGSIVSSRANQEEEDVNENLKDEVKVVLRLPLEEKITKLRELKKKYGSELVKKQVQFFIRKQTKKSWQRIAAESEKNDIHAFVEILWNRFAKAEGIKFTIHKDDDKTRIHCTHCPAVQQYKDLNALDWGFELYCSTDYYMTEGFNPNIQFERTKTLMQGHDCCNHTYSMKRKE